MSLRDYTAAFEGIMVLIMVIWDRILIERLSRRLAAIQKDIHDDSQRHQQNRDKPFPMDRQ
jgi:hypothetical protein